MGLKAPFCISSKTRDTAMCNHLVWIPFSTPEPVTGKKSAGLLRRLIAYLSN